MALMMCALSLGAAAQSTVVYPFNPDANSDGFVGVSDILEGVATYDNFFTPGEIMVGDTALSEWLSSLQNVLSQQQAEIDSLQFLIGTQANDGVISNVSDGLVFGEKEFLDLNSLPWQFVEFPQMEFVAIEAESDGILEVSGTEPGYYPYKLSVVPKDSMPCENNLSQCDGMTIASIFQGDNYSNYQYHDVWATDNARPLTIAVKKGEQICIRKDATDIALWQRFVWIPFISSTSQGNGDSTESSVATIQWESTVEDSVHIVSGNINTLRVVRPSASLESWWLHASPPINGSYVHYLNFSEIEDFVNSNGITSVNWLGPAWRGVMELDLSQLNSSSLEVEFDKICDERAQYSDAVLSLTSIGLEYSFSGQEINVVLYDGETRLADMTGPYKNWEFLYSPTATPPTVNDQLQEGYTGTAIMKFQRLESGQWVREH